MDEARPGRRFWHYALMALGVVALMAAAELAMGRVLVSKTGRVMLWNGVVASPENSQQIFDWYSFSHVIHGIVFYGALHLLGRRWNGSVGLRLVLAVAIEAAWEVFENTPFTIERYRKATIALDYYGDSVLNSVCDAACCAAGFLLAWKWPVWVSAALVVAMELFVLAMIRDNLTLNVVMLLWPVEGIRQWQSG
jgi:hypothetical protein